MGNYESFSFSDPNFTITTSCIGCGNLPCTCFQVPQQSGYVPVPMLGKTLLEDVAERLSVCVVCGAEDCLVLCEVCVEAVKQARNRWLDEFRGEIDEFLGE